MMVTAEFAGYLGGIMGIVGFLLGIGLMYYAIRLVASKP